MATWGPHAISILHGTFRPTWGAARVTRIDILPDPADLDRPGEVLQQGGRQRTQISFQAQTRGPDAVNDYNALLEAHIEGRVNTFSGPGNTVLDCLILDLGPPEMVLPDLIRFSVTLLEASA